MTYLLNFSVEGIACAIPNDYIQFVVQMIAMTKPGEDVERISGTVNIEGVIMPVYSLRRLFGFADRPPHTSDIMIIAHSGLDNVALWADEISDVRVAPTYEGSDACHDPAGLYLSTEGVVIINDLPSFLICADPYKVHAALPLPSKKVVVEDEDPVYVQAILEKRAKKMTRPVQGKNKVMPVEVLKFRLGNQEYALPMDNVREVILTGEITPVPGIPPYIPGICAIRGEILSLVDLQEFFKIRRKGLKDLNRVIVLTDGKITFGILAEVITGIGMIPREMLVPVKPGKTTIAGMYLLGAVEEIVILNAAALLTDPALLVNDTRI